MRITVGLERLQFLTAINELQLSISQTQNNMSSGASFTTAAQNPVAAGLYSGYTQVLAQSEQYTANANSAQSDLNLEDNALTQVQNSLQSLRSLALQANNATLTQQDRSAIAAQVSQIQGTLLSVANTQDGSGNYIFGGFKTQLQPFAPSAAGASYAGDQGERRIQIGAGATVAVADSGDVVFNQIKTGNGTFTVTSAAANTGSGVIGAASVSDPTAYGGGTYSINFTSPSTYQVLDSTNAVIASGTYAADQAIAFAGVQVTLSGLPAAGDSFTVAPSADQSIFATVQNLATALNQTSATPAAQAQLNNSIANAISNIDQALASTQNIQASVGARSNTVTTQLSVASAQQLQLQQSIATLHSLDYASAITSLDQQNTTLSAALQAYTLTQGLSLFKYL